MPQLQTYRSVSAVPPKVLSAVILTSDQVGIVDFSQEVSGNQRKGGYG